MRNSWITKSRTTNGRTFTYRAHVCCGTSSKGGRCTSTVLPDPARDGLYYCHWHTPDKKKRAISRFSPMHPKNNGKGGNPKRLSTQAAMRVMDKMTKKESGIGFPVTWEEMKSDSLPQNPGVTLASSLSQIVEEMVRESMKRWHMEQIAKLEAPKNG